MAPSRDDTGAILARRMSQSFEPIGQPFQISFGVEVAPPAAAIAAVGIGQHVVGRCERVGAERDAHRGRQRLAVVERAVGEQLPIERDRIGWELVVLNQPDIGDMGDSGGISRSGLGC